METVYCILGFPIAMHRESYSFMKLEVHQKDAKFNPSQSRTEKQGQMHKNSKMEAFVELNMVIPMIKTGFPGYSRALVLVQ